MSEALRIINAGAHGVGKTTFAREFLPHEAHCPAFINADLIAACLSPFNPEAATLRAGRLTLEEMATRVASTPASRRQVGRMMPWSMPCRHSRRDDGPQT